MVACLYALTLMVPCQSPAPSRLAVIQRAPDFQLIDQNGKQVRLSDLREDVLLVGFIFTTCNGTCPATTHQMAKVQEELDRRGLLKKGHARLLSITLDPRRDSPETLRNYMHLYEIDPGSWTFLTGPPDQVQRCWPRGACGLDPRPTGNWIIRRAYFSSIARGIFVRSITSGSSRRRGSSRIWLN